MAMSKVEEEETERLVMGTTKVVYYLEPLMSKELLCKSPDKSSASDFDYAQSSIWSPLVPRAYSTMDLDSDFEDLDFMTPTNRKISSGGGAMVLSNKTKLRKVTYNIKKKLNINLNLNVLKMKHMHKNKTKASEFSPTPLKPTFTCFPHTTKVVWQWQPYSENVIAGLPKYCLAGQDMVSPLICFHMVELHQPDLVLCQFDLQQGIPVACDTRVDLHEIDLERICHLSDQKAIQEIACDALQALCDHHEFLKPRVEPGPEAVELVNAIHVYIGNAI